MTTNKKLLPFLKGLNILENDYNNETLWAWSFPTIQENKKIFVLRKHADISTSNNFTYCNFQEEWCYIYTSQVFETDTLPFVKQCAIVVWSTEYCPEKYNVLCRILCKRYVKTGDPSVLLQIYLLVMTTGTCSTEENGTFYVKDFDGRLQKDYNLQLTEIIYTFGLETILIYTALLLNKRIFVYDHNLGSLQQTVDALPQFMTHRDFKNITFPWIHLNSDEIYGLKRHSGYIAGSTDNSIATRIELYDIIINVAAREVSVAPHARDAFIMTKTHKDIALFLVQLAESKNPNITIEITRKTNDLLTQLRSLAETDTPEGRKMISMENLRGRQFPTSLENFLFNLAVAENIMLL